MAKGRYRSRPSSASGAAKPAGFTRTGSTDGGHLPRRRREGGAGGRKRRALPQRRKQSRREAPTGGTKAETGPNAATVRTGPGFAVLLNLNTSPGSRKEEEPAQAPNPHNRAIGQPTTGRTSSHHSQRQRSKHSKEQQTPRPTARPHEHSQQGNKRRQQQRVRAAAAANQHCRAAPNSGGDRLMPLDSAVSLGRGGSRYIGSWGGVPPRQLPPELPLSQYSHAHFRYLVRGMGGSHPVHGARGWRAASPCE